MNTNDSNSVALPEKKDSIRGFVAAFAATILFGLLMFSQAICDKIGSWF